MDTPKSSPKSAHLLDDLESIRQLLGDDSLNPPLLTEAVANTAGDVQIPMLFEVVGDQTSPVPPVLEIQQPSNVTNATSAADVTNTASTLNDTAALALNATTVELSMPSVASITSAASAAKVAAAIPTVTVAVAATKTVVDSAKTDKPKSPDDLLHLRQDLQSAAQAILQDVIDDFTPHIQTEIKRRLDARLQRLLTNYPA